MNTNTLATVAVQHAQYEFVSMCRISINHVQFTDFERTFNKRKLIVLPMDASEPMLWQTMSLRPLNLRSELIEMRRTDSCIASGLASVCCVSIHISIDTFSTKFSVIKYLVIFH